jgi:hypothetical protein
MLTVAHGEVAAELAKANAPQSAYWAIAGVLVLLIAVMSLGAVFFYTLFEIVRSVDKGDTFDPANARRLAKMGWLSVAAQLLTIPLGAIALWAEKILPDGDGAFETDFGFGGGGIVLTLVLFILARVFRQGAAMREDLEGTV